MNIDPELRQIITRGARDESIEHIKDNPELFETLLEIAMSTDPAAWRATWIVQSTMKKNDARLELYIPEIINRLPICEDGQQREFLKILLKLKIGEEYMEFLYALCTDIWKNSAKQSSVRFYAIQTIIRLTEKNSDLALEVIELTDDLYLNTLSAGIKRSLQKQIKKLSKA